MYIQRIASTARIPIKDYMRNFKLDNRQALKSELTSQFHSMLKSEFETKGFVTRKEISSLFKKLLPNLDLNLVRHDNGAVKFKLTNEREVVSGYTVRLPFTFTDTTAQIIEKGDFKRLKTIHHETDHLMRFVTEPKYAMNYAKGGLSKKLDNLQWEFYNDFLYQNDLSALPYEKMLKLENSPQKRTLYVKQLMTNFFEDYICSPEEKIKLLQKWRYCLKDETKAHEQGNLAEITYKYPPDILAHKIGANRRVKLNEEFVNTYKVINFDSSIYPTKDEKISGLTSFIEEIKKERAADTAQSFFFSQKIKLIEEMLSDEISKIRVSHKKMVEGGFK